MYQPFNSGKKCEMAQLVHAPSATQITGFEVVFQVSQAEGTEGQINFWTFPLLLTVIVLVILKVFMFWCLVILLFTIFTCSQVILWQF